jgi:hypothetical protein
VSAKASNPNQCNIVQQREGQRKLWRYAVTGRGKTTLNHELTQLPDDTLPAKLVGKGWGDLWKPKLNVAWLPAGKVFMRVAEFPHCDEEELLAMAELQLEKLSPLPVTQIVWSIEPLPAADEADEMIQVILVIASRLEVERFLGKLESSGYLTDRLEIPELHQLLAAPKPGDGVWFLPRLGAELPSVLIAWWYGGTLRNLSVANLGDEESRVTDLRDQLSQVAWAGEMEGWLSDDPHFHLLGDTAAAEIWKPVLDQATNDAVTVDELLPDAQIASVAAQKLGLGQSRCNLMPAVTREHYRQKFIDSIWMRGLFAILLLYTLGVVLYFMGLEVLKREKSELNQQIFALSGSYTNAQVTKARIEILTEQIALKYAALESLKTVSAKLPDELTLDDFSFSKGTTVVLRGTTPPGNDSKVVDYFDGLKAAQFDGRKLFEEVTLGPIMQRGTVFSWNITARLDSPKF